MCRLSAHQQKLDLLVDHIAGTGKNEVPVLCYVGRYQAIVVGTNRRPATEGVTCTQIINNNEWRYSGCFSKGMVIVGVGRPSYI